MRGSAWTRGALTRAGSLLSGEQLRALAVCSAVGVAAGAAAALERIPLGLPGHKALVWMTPIVAASLLARHRIGATAAATLAGCSALALGGNLAGGALFLPLVTIAGSMLDLAAAFARRHGLTTWRLIVLFALAGGGANLLCLVKRLVNASYRHHAILGLSGLSACIVSYVAFGLAAGALGAAVGMAAKLRAKHDPTPPSP